MKAKRITAIIAVILLLCGCGTVHEDFSQGDKPLVIATIFPQYDFLRQICGDRADVRMLIRPGSESHNYDPSPSDIITVSHAALFVYAGGDSDAWVQKLLQSDELSDVTAVALTDLVPTVSEEITEGMQHSHSHAEDEEHHDDDHDHDDHDHDDHDHELEYDEHVWTSLKNAAIICNSLCDYMCAADSANADTYRENCANYVKKINELDILAADTVKNAVRKTIVFADRFPVRYFTEEYGLKYYAAFPGCASETEPSPSTLIFLIDKVRSENIPVVFYREFSNEKVADLVCESTKAKKLLFHSCHNVTADEFESGVTYIDIMRNNINNLKEAIN